MEVGDTLEFARIRAGLIPKPVIEGIARVNILYQAPESGVLVSFHGLPAAADKREDREEFLPWIRFHFG